MLAIMAMLTASKGLIVPPLDAIEGFPKVSFAVSLRPTRHHPGTIWNPCSFSNAHTHTTVLG